MGEVIDLDAVVPEDMVFKFRDKEYVLPGDIDVDTSLKLLRLHNRLVKAEGLSVNPDTGEKWEKNEDQQARITRELKAEYLKLFQVHQSDLKALPFNDVNALGVVHLTVMANLFPDSPNGDRPLGQAGTTKKNPKKATAISRSPRTSTRRAKRSG